MKERKGTGAVRRRCMRGAGGRVQGIYECAGVIGRVWGVCSIGYISGG